MISKGECRDWARYVRYSPDGYSSANTLWLATQAGKSTTFGPKNPHWQADPEIMAIHRVWRVLPEELKLAMYAQFAAKGDAVDRAGWAGMSKHQMYEKAKIARAYIAGALEAARNQQSYFPENRSA